MAITKEQFKAANARGAAALSRGARTGWAFIGRCCMQICMCPDLSKAPSVHGGGCNRSAKSAVRAAAQLRRGLLGETVSAAGVRKCGSPISVTRRFQISPWQPRSVSQVDSVMPWNFSKAKDVRFRRH